MPRERYSKGFDLRNLVQIFGVQKTGDLKSRLCTNNHGTHNHHFWVGITNILGMKTLIFHGFRVQGNPCMLYIYIYTYLPTWTLQARGALHGWEGVGVPFIKQSLRVFSSQKKAKHCQKHGDFSASGPLPRR